MEYLLATTIPGAAGGFACFLLGLHLGRIRNNKYVTKASLEIVGGMVVGSFIAIPFVPLPQYTISFLAGAAWSEIIQTIRKAITKRIEQVLRSSRTGGRP